MQRIRMGRSDRQNLLINLACLSETTNAMQPLAMLQMNVDLAVWMVHWPRVVRAEMEVRTYRVLCGQESLHAVMMPRRGLYAAPASCPENSRHPLRSYAAATASPRAQLPTQRPGRSKIP